MIKNFYIHIPFCRQKCSYCNFSTIQNSKNSTHEKYFHALKNEIKYFFQKKIRKKIKTIYFGGGTPSAVKTEYIGEILEIFKLNFGELKDVEILLESNPEDFSGKEGIKKLEDLKKIGITKISIGIQSFQEKFFNFFERKNYKSEEIIINAQKFFPNLSIDLIFGIPNQSEEDLIKDLEIIKKLDLKHVSYYALDYKKNSKIQNKKEEGLKFETVKNYYFKILDFFKKNNFEQYEFYNFCKKINNKNNYNFHNKNFWELENYAGFGISAVGYDGNFVHTNTKNLKKYLEYNSEENSEKEKISGFEKNFLELQKIFHLTRFKKINEIENILEIGVKKDIGNKNSENLLKNNSNNGEIILKKILNSNLIEKNTSKNGDIFIKLNNEGIMHFEDFFEEIFS